MKKHEHHLFLSWLIFIGVMFFLLLLSWQENILYLLFSTDRSRISVVITLMYFFVIVHCAVRVFTVSSQINLFNKVEVMLKNAPAALSVQGGKLVTGAAQTLPDCLTSEYIHNLINNMRSQQSSHDGQHINADDIEYFHSRLKAPQEIGWFAADIMIKMGLLGTIIGFILMLSSVADTTEFDVTTMQKILGHMSSGMGTALYTTMAGLVCSMLSAAQYQMIDQGADELIASVKHLTYTHILPNLK